MATAIGKVKRKTVSKYTALLRTKSAVCKGRKPASALTAAAASYASDAKKKGKPTAAIIKTITRVKNMACGMIAGVRKRKTVRRKRA